MLQIRALGGWISRFRRPPAGELLLDATRAEPLYSRRVERAIVIGLGILAILSIVFWKPLALAGVAVLFVIALLFGGRSVERTIRFYEFRLVVVVGPLPKGDVPNPTWRIEYGWIGSYSWDGDRLNLWLTDDRDPYLPPTLGVVIEERHQAAATRILRERSGRKREDLVRLHSS